MAKYFGTDGIRGKANIDLCADRAFEVGRYLGYYFSQEKKETILIGKDTRLSSSMFEHALAAGIVASGCDVALVGYCPTPMVSYLTRTHDFICGVMVSASHNPYYDNGIKVFSKEGLKLSFEIENLIEAYLDHEVTIPYATSDEIGVIYNDEQGRNDYIAYLEKIAPLDLSGLKIAVDCCNGSASTTAKQVLVDMHATPYVINMEPNGTNINTKCGSTHPKNLQDFVVEHGCDLGLAFDGDADRMILVNNEGELVTGDHILYVCGNYMKKHGLLHEDTVVTTVMANLGLFKAFETKGIRCVKTAVGDKYVYEEMCKHNYNLGGEQSGHIIFKEHSTTGDGLLTALMVLKVMLEEQKSLKELCNGLTIYPQLLVNIKVSDKNKAMEDEEIQAITNEVNEKLGTDGRLLVRPSGTEPLVRVMAEAKTDEICSTLVHKIADVVKAKFGVD